MRQVLRFGLPRLRRKVRERDRKYRDRVGGLSEGFGRGGIGPQGERRRWCRVP